MKVEITLTEEQIERILSQQESEAVEKKKDSGRFYPKDGEKYWCFECVGLGSLDNKWHDDIIDARILYSGMMFRTKEEAEENGLKNIERIKEINRVNRYIDENGLRSDASDEYHYNLIMENEHGTIVFLGTKHKELSILGDIKNALEAGKILEDCKEDLELIFNS